jgi:hypothetical protein
VWGTTIGFSGTDPRHSAISYSKNQAVEFQGQKYQKL